MIVYKIQQKTKQLITNTQRSDNLLTENISNSNKISRNLNIVSHNLEHIIIVHKYKLIHAIVVKKLIINWDFNESKLQPFCRHVNW